MASYDQVASEIDAKVRSMAGLSSSYTKFHQDTHIFDAGFLDSFGAVELIVHIDKTYGVKILDDDLASRPLNTVREIATLVMERLGKRG